MNPASGKTYWGLIIIIAITLLFLGALMRTNVRVLGQTNHSSKLSLTMATNQEPIIPQPTCLFDDRD